jgi:hypothetical protein
MEPEEPRCACGRERDDAAAFAHQSGSGRYIYRRCVCGSEWTERQGLFDPSSPISWDELLEVHEKLNLFRGSLSELLGPLKAQPATS